MAIDKTTILNTRTHGDHDNKVEVHGASIKVELQIEALKQEQEETHEEATLIESEYILVRDRPRRIIRPLQRSRNFVRFCTPNGREHR